MEPGEYITIIGQIAVLKKVAQTYSGKTIDNIITQMEARIKEYKV